MYQIPTSKYSGIRDFTLKTSWRYRHHRNAEMSGYIGLDLQFIIDFKIDSLSSESQIKNVQLFKIPHKINLFKILQFLHATCAEILNLYNI